ncbi:hypothetical protein GA0070606_4976 [Micromonospora citrea]|uniref:Uncharacterized protein n=1 Tax=Micromonospora citrea TaxID=47855 RepID=A0A1C6VRZ5_9ACTN|nr:hypothetical protein [Micromonospora citrea]SCL69101.1 hypothetical protein GA0070606_4976 [Micromonospora citrea]
MSKPWFARAAVVGGIVVATIVGSTAPALASNKSLSLSGGRGTMTFIDDGDMFQVCDTRADGHGVTGELFYRSWLEPTSRRVLTVDDGGDSGCDKSGYNVGNDGYYQMRLCWNGWDPIVSCQWSEEFNE